MTIFKIEVDIKKQICGNSQVVLWLGIPVSTAGGTGCIPGQGTKISHAKNTHEKIGGKKEFFISLDVFCH